MKLISYSFNGKNIAAILHNDLAYPVSQLDASLPDSMEDFLLSWDNNFETAKRAINNISQKGITNGAIPITDLEIVAPVPRPGSCRDGYAFRQHVEAARRNRGLPMIAAFDEYPVFYFTNHRSIQGPGKVICLADHFHKLDFELEVAIVICKEGINITSEDADDYIGGLMIMNDMSARTLQMEEMLLNLGPAKGKDFATCTGPWLVTKDELAPYEVAAKKGHTGKNWNLEMACFVNDKQVSSGNLRYMDWTFAEIIERASYGARLYPGDIIGSGTVGSGCFLELNGTGKLKDSNYQEQWLRHGDRIDMQVQQLGTLSNTVEKISDYSILKKKKPVS